MKLFRMLWRSIRDAFKSVFRNFSLSLASISCITITLIIVAIAMMASVNVENFANVIKRDVTMVVFLDNEVEQEDINAVEMEIKNIENVDSYEFKSKTQVKNEMQATSEVFYSIMKDWSEEESPLKDTFQIKVKDVKKIKDTADLVKAIDNVDLVRYGEGMIEQMIIAFEAVEKVAYGIVIALVVVTVFLIMNTIKLTIFSRKRAISIMRLVGASNFTIKTPFIVEGMVLGFIGAIVPMLIVVFGYFAFYQHFHGYLFSQLIQLVQPEPFIYQISILVAIIGMLVGMIGSASAVRKYLKV